MSELANTSRDIRLIKTRKRGFPHTGWAWEDIVDDFERALEGEGARAIGSGAAQELLDTVGRMLSRMQISRPVLGKEWRFIAMMGTKPRLLFPHAYRGRIVMYVWDCWPDAERRWASIFASIRPEMIFFSSKRAADFWAPRLTDVKVEWLPEAIDPAAYSPGSELASRNIDLLEIGRPFNEFNTAVSPRLKEGGMKHLHPTADRPHLFRSRLELTNGIASAKALACFPASVTEPHGRNGGWETMTYRYIEAVASRTLIVGQIPQEMTDLFGFTPGVNLDPGDYARNLV